MKTTLSNEIMLKISDIIEEKLKENEEPYIRDGTNFQVFNPQLLFKFQGEANEQLIKEGIITQEMLEKEIANFS